MNELRGQNIGAGAAYPRRVLMAGRMTALDSPGGGEIQMFALAEALRALGVDARAWRPWEESFAGADCLHLFGSLREHLPLVAMAHRSRVPVVLSPIAWFDAASLWREPRRLGRRVAALAMFYLRTLYRPMPSWRRRLYGAVDLLLPNSKAEARQLQNYFAVPAARIAVVPNGADERFAAADGEPFAARVGGPGFVLSCGRIEPRKNQRELIAALAGTGQRLVVVGDPVPGHEAYYAACRAAANASVCFLPRMDHDDPLLASAYAACGCLVLNGWYETPGLVALEAAMTGTPLVLPDGGSAAEYFGDEAQYVAPGHPRRLLAAVKAAIAQGRSAGLAQRVREHFSWRRAAEIHLEVYRRVGAARPAAGQAGGRAPVTGDGVGVIG